MNLERMNRLITVLEGVEAANKAFDLTRWIADARDLEGEETTSGSFGEACGTACCALGYAALDPQFRGEGLRLELWAWNRETQSMNKRELPSASSYNKAIAEMRQSGLHYNIVPACDGADSFEAGDKFFGISNNATHYLFDPDYYEDGNDRPILPSEVIARVREVIACDGESPIPDEDDAA